MPTADYEPRCGCCPLLRSRRIDGLEWGSVPDGAYAGDTHDLRIEAVDEPTPDALFRR
jgi:hypothetical protein